MSGLQNTAVGVRQGGVVAYRDQGAKLERAGVVGCAEVLCVTGDIAFNSPGGVVALGAPLPPGAVPLKLEVHVVTAFDAGTTNTLALGTAASPASWMATGVLDPTSATIQRAGLGAQAPLTAATQLQLTYGQTGTAAAHGKARATVYYALP